MLIKDLKPHEGNVDLDVKIVEIGDIKETLSHGKQIRVAKAVIEDGSGKCVLTLWNEEINNLKVGDHILIRNGWCNEFRGEIQVSAGKYGAIERVGAEGELVEIPHEEPKEETQKQTKFFEDVETEYSDEDILTYDGDDEII